MPAGRKPAHYIAKDGTQIRGLARRPSDGRWRVIGTDITFVCEDEALAIHKYLTRYSGKQQAAVEFVVPPPDPGTPVELMPILTRLDPASHQTTQVINEGAVWSWVRQQILLRPQYVAQMTGIEQIGYLVNIPKPTVSPTLEEVGKLYVDQADVSANWRAKCVLFWKEFRESVEVITLRELTQEHIIDYADMVRDAGETPTYARQRFGAIKTIINFPPKRGKWAEDAKRALALCGVLVPPKKSAVDPKPISPAAFQALYRAADPQMQAMLLLALNCCMYGEEVAALDWADLNLDQGVVSTERGKTGMVRIAVLWGRTIEVLRKLERSGHAVFLTDATRMRHNYQTMYKAFKVVRKAAGQEDVQFSQIRDGAYTAAVEAGVPLDVCRLLAGHATGISDHYVKRRPQMVAPACKAVEEAYFGT